MCITTHFYDRHNLLVNRLIAFRVIEGSHTGTRLADTFFEVMEEYEVTHKVSFYVLIGAPSVGILTRL